MSRFTNCTFFHIFQVSELNLEVQTRNQEIQAAELRLSRMEQDMVEMSVANENYRSQIMTFSTRLDITETELRAVRSQESWIGPEIQDFQRLNEELNEQKEELQTQISIQSEEIENLSKDLRELREELDRVNRMLDYERQKRNLNFQDDTNENNQR